MLSLTIGRKNTAYFKQAYVQEGEVRIEWGEMNLKMSYLFKLSIY